LKTVRSFAVLLCLTLWLPIARGQEQERKLADRLLNPDMELQNKNQQKKFVADGASVDKPANVGTFYVQKKRTAKGYSSTREFAARQFDSQSSRSGNKAANVSSRTEITNSKRAVPTQDGHGVRDAHESGKIVDSRDYSGKRRFLERGKSQKSLERLNPPMTIDEVRELLNKNK
jgi:hypothetical protein